MTTVELILNSACARCGQIGHWATKKVVDGKVVLEECQRAPDERALAKMRASGSGEAGGHYLCFGDDSKIEIDMSPEKIATLQAPEVNAFLPTLEAQQQALSLLDTGAGGEIGGEEALRAELECLKRVGARCVRLPKASPAHGVGGSATPTSVWLCPVFLAGASGPIGDSGAHGHQGGRSQHTRAWLLEKLEVKN